MPCLTVHDRDRLTLRARYRHDSRYLQRPARQRIGIVILHRVEGVIRLTAYIQARQRSVVRSRESLRRECGYRHLIRRNEMQQVGVRRTLVRRHHDTCRTVRSGRSDRHRLILVGQHRDLRHRRRGPRDRIIERRRLKALQRVAVQIDHLQESILGFLDLKAQDILTRRSVSGGHRHACHQQRLVDRHRYRLIGISCRPTDRRQTRRTCRQQHVIRECLAVKLRDRFAV